MNYNYFLSNNEIKGKSLIIILYCSIALVSFICFITYTIIAWNTLRTFLHLNCMAKVFEFLSLAICVILIGIAKGHHISLDVINGAFYIPLIVGSFLYNKFECHYSFILLSYCIMISSNFYHSWIFSLIFQVDESTKCKWCDLSIGILIPTQIVILIIKYCYSNKCRIKTTMNTKYTRNIECPIKGVFALYNE